MGAVCFERDTLERLWFLGKMHIPGVLPKIKRETPSGPGWKMLIASVTGGFWGGECL